MSHQQGKLVVTTNVGSATATEPRTVRVAYGPLAIAGAASLGAGAVHAVAVGTHGEHPQSARAFLVLALLQVGWGAWALAGRHRLLAGIGFVISASAVGGWVLAKTTGIGFVDGMGEAEAIQRADALAAGLAALAAVIALRSLVAGDRSRAPGRSVLGVATIALVAVSLLGMDGAGSHAHQGGHRGGETAGHGGSGAGHGHDGTSTPAGDDAAHDDSAAHEDAAPHEDAATAPTPYDPTKPIDLGGTAGVTPEEQARAENLVAITLDRLPRYADYKAAEADGYRSIRDGPTGHEHFINWSYVNDDKELNPDSAEALVYEVGPNNSRTLVSAMFMLPSGATLDDVPELGGKLTQWHIHDDLCLSADPVAPYVAGLTSVGGDCAPPTRKLEPVPMIHVWITKHPCGPFASLEGVAAGQVKAGETRACDHAHGG